MNVSNGKPNDAEVEMKNEFCWGVLFFMQGRNDEAVPIFKSIIGNNTVLKPLKGASLKILDYITVEGTRDRLSYKKRSDILFKLISDLEEILGPKGYLLSVECPRCEDKRRANDGLPNGYSRDPFKVISIEHKADICLAAIIYLLRGFSTFFCRPKDLRDYHAAKVALNDFFQCGQLGWRLYRSLCNNHSITGSHDDYHEKVINGGNPSDPSQDSSYFIWTVLELLEIQRGNIYKQVEYLDEANRYYRHFCSRLEQLEKYRLEQLEKFKDQIDNQVWIKKFVTPTVIKAFSEMAEIQYDRGRFLESLINQVTCLSYLVKTNLPNLEEAQSNSAETLLGDLRIVMKFLISENRQPVFDIFSIEECFIAGDGALFNTEAKTISPIRFQGLIRRDLLDFAVDIFARIGLTILTLHRRHRPHCDMPKDEQNAIESKQGEFEKNLLDYFRAHKVISSDKDITPSWLGQYLEWLISSNWGNMNLFIDAFDIPEKLFVARINASINRENPNTPVLKETEFYQAILAATTRNILNIATVPRHNQRLLMQGGYRVRRTCGDLSRSSVSQGVEVSLSRDTSEKNKINRLQNKIVILRRWQSINPRIPRPDAQKIRGGGYFLFWQNKGIVIDPGFDFIQNFYDEGFSLGDIDAVMVSHSHPDHDDDLSTLTALIQEWNEYYESVGECDPNGRIRKIDIFLNESANLKFSAWLMSSGVKIGRLIPLPSTLWDKDSDEPFQGRIRGGPVIIDLREYYNLKLEVIPAWHDDVIGKTEAVGLKFHLYDPKINLKTEGKDNKIGILGYTGDTGAYGTDDAGLNRGGDKRIEDYYKDCDVLIAHLGDIRIRELLTKIGKDKKWYAENILQNPVHMLFLDWFKDPNGSVDLDKNQYITSGRVSDFVRFLIALDLIPHKALMTPIQFKIINAPTLSVWLSQLSDAKADDGKRNISIKANELESVLEETGNAIFDKLGFKDGNPIRRTISGHIRNIITQATVSLAGDDIISSKRLAWALVGFICSFAILPWRYPYHLGVAGLYRLFSAMMENCQKEENIERIFVVGELPEELTSYRHKVAQLLNMITGNLTSKSASEVHRQVHAFTGDIGLHIALDSENDKSSDKNKLSPKIRCAYCNHNNEAVLSEDHLHYHKPSKMLEVPVKRLNSGMYYLCTEYDHYPEQMDFPQYFLSHPNFRVI
jgi:hypothetical protein